MPDYVNQHGVKISTSEEVARRLGLKPAGDQKSEPKSEPSKPAQPEPQRGMPPDDRDY